MNDKQLGSQASRSTGQTSPAPTTDASKLPKPGRKKHDRSTSAAEDPLVAREALVEQYMELTKQTLPRLAKQGKWPIRWDHCFQRVALDNAFQGCWYDHLDRKKGTAISQIQAGPLARAVAAARRMEEEGIDAVFELDAHSLRYRGKKPKTSK